MRFPSPSHLYLRVALLCAIALAASPIPLRARDVNPCALLAQSDVRRVYPDAQAGVPDLSLAKQGTLRCTWKHGAGTLFLVTGDDTGDSAADEAESWSLSIVDPLRNNAERLVRYETVAGIGDAAVAVVERRNPAMGFIQDGAYIAVRRGRSLVSLLAPDLARGDRAAALRRLSQLARALALPH